METIASLTSRHSQNGQIEWIGLRPARDASMEIVDEAEISQSGLMGDRSRAGKRAVTLIQAEHLAVIASLAGHESVTAETLRRNILVSGINLIALRGKQIKLGEALLEITAPCAPCSKMEAALGPGGYNAMRGHGGWCAKVITPGQVALGDRVSVS